MEITARVLGAFLLGEEKKESRAVDAAASWPCGRRRLFTLAARADSL